MSSNKDKPIKIRRVELTDDQVAVILDKGGIQLDLPADVVDGTRTELGHHVILSLAIHEKVTKDDKFIEDMTNFAISKMQIVEKTPQ